MESYRFSFCLFFGGGKQLSYFLAILPLDPLFLNGGLKSKLGCPPFVYTLDTIFFLLQSEKSEQVYFSNLNSLMKSTFRSALVLNKMSLLPPPLPQGPIILPDSMSCHCCFRQGTRHCRRADWTLASSFVFKGLLHSVHYKVTSSLKDFSK